MDKFKASIAWLEIQMISNSKMLHFGGTERWHRTHMNCNEVNVFHFSEPTVNVSRRF